MDNSNSKNHNIAIMASGRGSNAQAILEYLNNKPDLNLNVKVIITNNPNAKVIQKAKDFNIPVTIVPVRNFTSKAKHEEYISLFLKSISIDWILLAGYMKILSINFLKHFWDNENKYYKIINIHPSLLPAFPGLNSYKRAFDAGGPYGVTLHLVDDKVDTGPILIQKKIDRFPNDTLEDFTKRGLECEHKVYKSILPYIANNCLKDLLKKTTWDSI